MNTELCRPHLVHLVQLQNRRLQTHNGGGNGENCTASYSEFQILLRMFKRRPETQNYDSQDHSQKRTKKDAQKKRRKATQTPKTPDISDDEPNFVKK